MTDEKHKHSIDEDEIDCTIAIEQLYAYLDGELNDERSIDKFEHHVHHCRSCLSRLELETALNKRMQNTTSIDVPKSLQNRLKSIIDKL